MIGRKVISWFVLVVFAAFIGACNNGNPPDNDQPRYTSATIVAGFDANPAGAKTFGAPFIGTAADVTSMMVDVNSGATAIVTGATLTQSGGAWSAAIENLPVGPQLTFIGHAYNASSQEIFTGTTYQAMTGTSDQVALQMAPVSSGVTMQFPKITQVMIASPITVSSSANLRIFVEGSSTDTLSYQITLADGGGRIGSFTTAQGAIIMAGSTAATIVYVYTAPDVPGTYTHSVKVTNKQGNSVEASFDTTIVDQEAAPEAPGAVSVQFNPVVLSISGRRSGSDVAFTANVSDDGPAGELAYLWSFSGLSFQDNTTNPAVLQGYDQNVSGTLQLTVRDRNGQGGSTTVSYPLPAGLFPDTLVVTPSPVVLATGIGEFSNMAVDLANVYWTDAAGGTVKKVSVAGGSVATLASGLSSPQGIAVYGGYVFWTEATAQGAVKKVSTGGGGVTTLASGLNVPSRGIAIVNRMGGPYVYWTETGSGLLKQVPVNGGAVVTVASGLVSPSGNLVYDGSSYLYWAEGNGTIRRVNDSGSPVVNTVVSGLTAPRFIAADMSNVYWTESGANGSVKKVSTGGGGITVLASGLDNPGALVKDFTGVYWAENTAIRKVALSGGAVYTVASGLNAPSGLAVSNLNAYWGDGSSGGSFTKLPL